MKKFLLVLFFSILFVNSKAQTSVYHPFPDSNAVWNVYLWGYGGCFPTSPYPLEEWYSYILYGDTTINSVVYHTLYRPYIKSVNCIRDTAGITGFIRQDTSSRKVYIIFSKDTLEQLLYDFNMQVGDTVKGVLEAWSSPSDTVTAIDSVKVGSNYRKRWNINPCYGIYLIEGIGSNYGLIQPSPHCVTDAGAFSLLCFSQNGIPLYPDTATTCAIVDGINSPSEKNISISVYPNPASNKITVRGYHSGKDARVDIYNLMGEKLQSSNLKSETTIDVSDLAAGVYLVQVSDGNQTRRVKMIKE